MPCVNLNLPAAISATGTNCPALTVDPLSDRVPVPTPGTVTILTARKLFGGVSFESENPKSLTRNTYGVPSTVVTEVDVPTGGKSTGSTVNTNDCATLVSTPPLAVPPLS